MIVADDAVLFRDGLSRLLSDAGIEVGGAGGGGRAPAAPRGAAPPPPQHC